MGDRTRGRLLVAAQFLLIGLIALAPGNRLWPRPAWLVLVELILIVLGLAMLVAAFVHLGPALTANPVPKVDAPLRTNGIYAYVRHPIYTGLLLSGLGVSLWRSTAVSLIAFVCLFLLLDFKARWEESLLASKHPGYLSYRRRVPRFLPKLKRTGHVD